MTLSISKAALLTFTAVLTAGCSGGGKITFTSPKTRIEAKGSPNVSINQGGQALIVEQGKTPTTGVHGWVAIQSVASGTLTSSTGGTAVIMNRPTPVNGGRGLSSQ